MMTRNDSQWWCVTIFVTVDGTGDNTDREREAFGQRSRRDRAIGSG
jgi:hypothetical protein